MASDINRKFKIAEVITRLDWAGSPDIVRIICENLPPEYEATLIVGDSKDLTGKTKEFLKNFKGKIINVPCLKRDINPFFDLIAFFKLYAIFKEEKFDLVHTHTAKAGFLGRLAARFAGVGKIVHMPHGHNFYGYFGKFLSGLIIAAEKLAGKFTDEIIVLTELEKRDYLKFGIISHDKISVVPSGLELDDFDRIDSQTKQEKRKELGLGPNEKLVGLASRLEHVKGSEYFVEAAAKVLNKISNVKFLVIGEGSLRHKMEKRSRELGISEKIKFLGWREDVIEIISILDILILPSLNEAIGRVILEAELLGVPVVATKVGGIPEVVHDGVTGVLVDSGKSDALAEAILRLLSDEALRRKMSQQAHAWARVRFSSSLMMEGIIKIYNRLLK